VAFAINYSAHAAARITLRYATVKNAALASHLLHAASHSASAYGITYDTASMTPSARSHQFVNRSVQTMNELTKNAAQSQQLNNHTTHTNQPNSYSAQSISFPVTQPI
jgi:hypothetical protein